MGAVQTFSRRIRTAPPIPHQAVVENPLNQRCLFGGELAPPRRSDGVGVSRRSPDGLFDGIVPVEVAASINRAAGLHCRGCRWSILRT